MGTTGKSGADVKGTTGKLITCKGFNNGGVLRQGTGAHTGERVHAAHPVFFLPNLLKTINTFLPTTQLWSTCHVHGG